MNRNGFCLAGGLVSVVPIGGCSDLPFIKTVGLLFSVIYVDTRLIVGISGAYVVPRIRND